MGRWGKGPVVLSAAMLACIAGCPSSPSAIDVDAGHDAATAVDAGPLADAPGADGGDDGSVSEAGPCASPDHDGDGEASTACGGHDCDDTDAHRFPGNAEVCDTAQRDEDCDPTTYGYRDADSDGDPDARCCNVDAAGSSHCGTDCDDMRASVSSTTPEVCNGADDDCDTAIDEGVLRTFHPDADMDGFGATGGDVMACDPPVGYVENAGDCDDTNASVHTATTTFCRDADGDMHGTPSTTMQGCTASPGYVVSCDDCNDAVPTTYPGASELCNRVDDDCSSGGGVDTSEDVDGDHYTSASNACSGGYPKTDCDDGNASVHPGAGFSPTPRSCANDPATSFPTTWDASRVCCATGPAASCSSAQPDWDWDCSGYADQEPNGTCMTSPLGGCSGSGWSYGGSGTVRCGSPVTPFACVSSSLGCMPISSTTTRPLECR